MDGSVELRFVDTEISDKCQVRVALTVSSAKYTEIYRIHQWESVKTRQTVPSLDLQAVTTAFTFTGIVS